MNNIINFVSEKLHLSRKTSMPTIELNINGQNNFNEMVDDIIDFIELSFPESDWPCAISNMVYSHGKLLRKNHMIVLYYIDDYLSTEWSKQNKIFFATSTIKTNLLHVRLDKTDGKTDQKMGDLKECLEFMKTKFYEFKFV